MSPKLCRYQCGVMLEGFDEENRKFLEAGTGGLHTKERCQEAKAKLEAKNDHGNESEAISPKQYVERLAVENKFVDHTQPAKLKLKVLTSTEAEGLSLLYNTFGESHTIRFSQSHVTGSHYVIFVWYEEIPLKQ